MAGIGEGRAVTAERAERRDGSPAVEVRGLTVVYPAERKTPARTALDGVGFDVGPGELFGLLGPNGGGKSTLCKVLTTLLAPTAGGASVLGVDVARDPAAIRRGIGVVFQSPSLDKRLTVRENLVHQGHLYGLRGGELAARLEEMLGRMGLSDRAEERVDRLSGGLKRRVELAKGLLHRPKLLILDEPTTGVDPGARTDLWNYLKALKAREGITLLVATHLMEEAERCDRLAILHKGRLVALGTPEALKSEIGGDVIWIQTAEPGRLAGDVRAKFGVDAEVVDGTLRVERPQGHEFIPSLVEAFPGRIASVTLSKPTLEDVFIHRTNHRFWSEAAETDAEKKS